MSQAYVRPDLWSEIERVVDAVFSGVVDDLLRSSFERGPSLFVSALLGRVTAVNSRAERLITTRIGEVGPRIVSLFFEDVESVPAPFHFRGRLIRKGRVYVVKVVSGPKAFNSTTRKAVEEASYRYDNPIILTLQGVFKRGGEHVKEVGRARWYDAVATWSLLTGESNAYKRFAKLVFKVARPYRSLLISKLIDERSR